MRRAKRIVDRGARRRWFEVIGIFTPRASARLCISVHSNPRRERLTAFLAKLAAALGAPRFEYAYVDARRVGVNRAGVQCIDWRQRASEER